MNRIKYLALVFLLFITSCVSNILIPDYSVELQSRVGYCIWVDGVFFGESRFPVGGTCGGSASSSIDNVTIPNEAIITWKKLVDHTKYKDQVPHKAIVPIPKPLPPKKSNERYIFIFTINKDQTVSLKISTM